MNVLTRRAQLFDEQLSATTRRSRTGTASSTSTTRTSRRSARSPPSGAASNDPQELVTALHQHGGSRRGAARRPTSSRRSSASSARSTASSSQQPYDAADAWRKLLEVDPATSRRWPRSRRSTRAPRSAGPRSSTSRCSAPRPRGPAREDPRVPSGRRALGETGQRARTRRRPRGEDPRDRRRRTTRRSSQLEKLHTAGEPLGAAHRALPRAPRHARGDVPSRPTSSAASRGSSRRSSTTRTRRSTRSSTRFGDGLPRRETRQLPRAHGAGHRTAGASSSRPRTTGSRQQTEPHAEDPPLPAPRQVVRRGPRAPRVRAALLRADRRARSEQRRRAAPDGAASIARTGNWQQLGATLTRALDVAVTDVDRKEILTELGELLDSADEPDRSGARLLQARARRRPALPPGAREPRAHLRRSRA